MPIICSIDRSVDEVLERLPAHIHMGMPLGLGKANRNSSAITISGALRADSVSVKNRGPTANSHVVIGATGSITGTGSGLIEIAALSSGGTFNNNVLSMAGGLDVTYARDGKGWAVFSGLKGAQIVYAKAIDACDASHVFVVTYPAERKAFYDPIVTRLSRSLRCRASR